MGRRNFLIEGVSCSGKTTVCMELRRRGYEAINGDTDLAEKRDLETWVASATRAHENHVWPVERVEALASNRDERVTFFCGGSRNFSAFIQMFDAVFVLDVDEDTLLRRLDERPVDEFGAKPAERALILQLHRTKADIPVGRLIDATQPLSEVVDEVLRLAGVHGP